MRLTVLFLTAGFFHVSATGVSQNITFSGQNVPLQSVFSSVKKQTGFVFLYSDAVIKSSKPVTIDARSLPLEEFLSTVFRTQPLEYLIEGKSIFISPKFVTSSNGKEPKSVFEFFDVALIDVRGRVANEIGEPVLATVTVKGANRSTTTDDNGYFELKQIDENAILVFTGVGIETHEVRVAGRTDLSTINIRTRVDQAKEVVVIGYGTQSRKDLTGAVGQVNSDEIKNLPLVSVEQALQGRVSGVKVKHNGGDLKNNFGINIRGVNSTSNGGQPLFVVDGVPLAAGTLSNINPADIATMDVLKDASATAIYGSRAANGVVMITTKNGSGRGKDVVDFTTEAGILTPVIPFEMADAFLQAEIVKESLTEAQITIPDELNDPQWLAENNNDWQELATRNGNFQKYNLSLSGGSEKTQYLLSGFYSRTEGVLINTNYKIGGFRLNLDHKISNKLKVGTRLSATVDGGNLGTFQTNGFWSIWKQALMDLPWFPHKNPDGSYKKITTTGVHAAHSFNNPISEMEQNVYNNTSHAFIGNAYVEYELIKGLKFKYLLGGEVNNARTYVFLPIYDNGAYKRLSTEIEDAQTRNTNWVSDATLTYDTKIRDHKITALAGYSAQRYDSRLLRVVGYGALNNQINQITGQPETLTSGGTTPSGLSSYFARAFYSFRDKYLVTATVRRDGSSRFSPSKRWGNFPSASVGWQMSEEPFMKTVGFVSDVKWRISYGLTGNQDIVPFSFIPLVSPNNYAFGNGFAPGFAVNNPANPFLQWESLKQFDAGLEMSFFNRRVNVVLDYFIKRSDNLLSNTTVAPTSGYTGSLIKNIGIIENRGFETEIHTVNSVGTLKWNSDLNFAFVKNEVINLGLDINGDPMRYFGSVIYQSPATLTTAGHPISSFYGYVMDGIWQLGKEDEAAAAFPGLKPGDMKFRDLNNDGKITADDRDFIGSPWPKFYGGFTNTLNIKNLTLTIFTDFSVGAKVLNTPMMLGESTFWYQGSMEHMKDRWTPTNPSNTIHRSSQSTAPYNARPSTRYVQNADFFRFNNVALTYDFHGRMISRLKLQALRLSVIGNNLYTITSYEGYNVEAHTGSFKNDPLNAGLDMGTYPLNRMYSVKLNVVL
ncbi:MAG: TonB-dependent receptor [Chitinophagaceae bacterium]|nr:TonB-dependent receptor [Chitinophagaceae bacterium]